jgi:hypothetical protein
MHFSSGTLAVGFVVCLLFVPAASAGNMAQWHYDGTTWTRPYIAVGNFTHGVANYHSSGINQIAALTDATGVAEYHPGWGGPGEYGKVGYITTDPTVTDVDTDDLRNGARQFMTSPTGIVEILDSGGWNPASTVVSGPGYTVGVIANDQDWVWALNGGTINLIERTSLTTWAAPVAIGSGPYIDLTAKSRGTSAIVFALTDDGFDEYYGNQLVRSHRGLFSGATGISTWEDQDNLFVSTTSGLLRVRRDSGLSFTPAGVSVIDGSVGYADVDAATMRVSGEFDLWAIQVPEPATLGLLAIGAALLLRRRMA